MWEFYRIKIDNEYATTVAAFHTSSIPTQYRWGIRHKTWLRYTFDPFHKSLELWKDMATRVPAYKALLLTGHVPEGFL